MKRKGLTLSLMTLSIVFLLILQMVWLDNAYEKAFIDYRREFSVIFRTAVMAVRDSALFKQIESVPATDSAWVQRFPSAVFFATRGDSIRKEEMGNQTIEVKRYDSPQVQVTVSSRISKDSVRAILKPYATRIKGTSQNAGTRFLIRVDHDSLNIDSIHTKFSGLIRGSRFDHPFTIKKSVHLPLLPPKTLLPSRFDVLIDSGDSLNRVPVSPFSDSLSAEWVHIDPVVSYGVTMKEFRPAIVRELLPQFMFAFFLTTVTGLAFAFMYRSMQAQERLMKLKNDFISNITHEIKTPIATVSVALEALRHFKAKDNLQATTDYLDMARHELDRLALLADKVLTTSQFDEHGIRLHIEEVDLASLTAGVLQSMRLLFEKQKAQVQLTQTGTSFVLAGDRLHLTNLVFNLLDNAVKYSPSGGVIQVSLVEHADSINLAVADHGIGIPGEYHDRIFDKFFRVPSGDVHNTKGYGLGLSYVHNVASLHHGSVELKSKPGEGSCFTVLLPKKQVS